MIDIKLKAKPELKLKVADSEDFCPNLRDMDTSIVLNQLQENMNLREMSVEKRLKKGLLQ
jgi:hypothetical protein